MSVRHRVHAPQPDFDFSPYINSFKATEMTPESDFPSSKPASAYLSPVRMLAVASVAFSIMALGACGSGAVGDTAKAPAVSAASTGTLTLAAPSESMVKAKAAGGAATMLPNGVYTLTNMCSGKVLDVQGASNDALAPVQIWQWGGATNQQWEVQRQADSTYMLKAVHSGLVLDIAGGSFEDNAAMIQYPWHGGANQKWVLESQGAGQWLVKSSHSGKALAVNSAARADGGAASQSAYNGSCERWKIQTAVATVAEPVANGKIYYVSPSGNGGNDGLSENTPLPTLNSAMSRMQAGDTMLVMNGTYTETCNGCGALLFINKAGRPDAWISVKAYPGHKPRLQATPNTDIGIGMANAASYILIEGLELVGMADQLTFNGAYDNYKKALDAKERGDGNYRKLLEKKYSVTGIGTSSYADNGQPAMNPHHITLRNNVIRNQSGCGMCLSGSDYLTIEDNMIYDNAKYAAEAHSGISIYQPSNFDSHGNGYSMVIRRNIIFKNEQLVPFIYPDQEKVTDGNGIILDDFYSEQTYVGTVGQPYSGRTLIENNIISRNGGSGILAGGVENVDIVNNTLYHNSRPESVKTGDFQYVDTDSEIGISVSKNIRVFNNIMVAYADKPVNRFVETDSRKLSGIEFSNNLVFGGNQFNNAGVNNLVGVDPLFVDAANGDFRVQANSPVIDKGSASVYSGSDFFGGMRYFGGAPDIGVYEAGAPGQ
jgi:parallel beta-helix repeat protein